MTAPSSTRPMIEVWYKASRGDVFEVVNVDEQEDAIEIQYLDGSVEELDEDAWESLEPEMIDPPREALRDGYDEDLEGEDFAEDQRAAWGDGFDDYE